MIRRWLKRILIGILFVTLATTAVIVLRTNPEPLTSQEVARLTIALNEAAAIGVPHDFLMKSNLRQAHLAVLEKVEAGVPLSVEEDMAYRALFQTVLWQSQGFLSVFDGELSVLLDHGMTMPNNIAGEGIKGNHDHHDLSARKNFAELLLSLQHLQSSTYAISRIYYANRAQKDLVDLISHLGVAPHTISVANELPEVPWPDQALGQEFEAMLQSFKSAQFALVNSAEYWSAVDNALQHYANLILAVQQQVHNNTAPWQRKIAGQFNSLQTLAPPVNLNRPLRRK